MRPFAWAALAVSLSPTFAGAAPLTSAIAGRAAAPAEAPSEGTRIALRQQTLPPGGKLPEHRQNGDRYLFVVSGRLKVSDLVTGDEQVVEAGKMASEQPGDWHVAEALGTEPVVLYIIDRAPQTDAVALSPAGGVGDAGH
jgi:quercetin dioxygenase-like cupin family protein